MFYNATEFTAHYPVSFLSASEEFLYYLIIHRTGIVLRDHQMQVLRSALAEACTYFGHSDTEVLLQRLKQNNNPSPELEFLLTRITIGESYFFRHTEQNVAAARRIAASADRPQATERRLFATCVECGLCKWSGDLQHSDYAE